MIFTGTGAYKSLGKTRYNNVNIYPIVQNDKIGFIDKKGSIIIQPEFGDMIFDDEGMIAFLDIDSNRWGYMNSNFNVIFKPQLKIIYPEKYSCGLAAYCDESIGRRGYIDKNGVTAISPNFFRANSFKNNFATVTISKNKVDCWDWRGDDIYGVINKNGDLVIEPIYGYLGDYQENLIIAERNKCWGCIDINNNVVIPFKYEWLDLAGFTNGLIFALYKGKWGVINKYGEVIIDFKIVDKGEDDDTSRGIGRHYKFSSSINAFFYDGKWILFNGLGEAIKTLNEYHFVGDYINGYARAITINDEEHLIDEDGNVIFSVDKQIVKESGPFSEGLSPAVFNATNDKIYGKYGYIDTKGKWIIPPVYDWAYEFNEGFAPIGIKGIDAFSTKYGLIDKNGDYLVKPCYEYINRFYNDLVLVCKSWFPDDKYGYINKLGEIVYEPTS